MPYVFVTKQRSRHIIKACQPMTSTPQGPHLTDVRLVFRAKAAGVSKGTETVLRTAEGLTGEELADWMKEAKGHFGLV